MNSHFSNTTNVEPDNLWNNFNKFNPGSLNTSTTVKSDNNTQKRKSSVLDSKKSSKRKKTNNCVDVTVDVNTKTDNSVIDGQNNTGDVEIKRINEYVSASGVKNYLLQDPMLDWFEEHRKYKKHSSDQSHNTEKFHTNENTKKKNLLFEGGIAFENKINHYLKHQYGSNVIEINTKGRLGCTRENYDRTIQAMMNGFPIILQGVVFNDFNKTHGTFDLIVRSDYINKLIKRPVLEKDLETLKAPKLSGNYHYVVIDIKWTTMTLCANGYTIRNEGRFPSYKGQLAIYNCAIGNMQGYIPPKAYIMAKAWKIDKKHDQKEGYDFLDLLGEIDYTDFDYKYIDNTIGALGWIRTVRRHGDEWNLYNPVVPEMYPNCSNKLDSPWTKEKMEIADKIGELTNVWNVTLKHRQTAHKNGIKSWKDPNCTSALMGITTEGRAKVIDKILEVNRSTTDVIKPMCIKNDVSNWQTVGPTDFYIDFETTNCCFQNPEINIHNSKTQSDMVFMIGVGHVENEEFVYKVFCANNLSFDEEERIFDDFSKYLVSKIKELDPNLEYVPRLFHWGFAEQANVNHVNVRHFNKYLKLFNFCQWVDMYTVFISEPIVVKGSLDFKLKHIGKAMYNHGFVTTQWNDKGPSDGLSAMLSAIECYEKENINTQEYQLIIDYNKIDCKILWEILTYLRNNHCV